MATAAEISALYNKYLGRDPLQSGIDAWLATGQSIEQIEQGIANSPEASVVTKFTEGAGRLPSDQERQYLVVDQPAINVDAFVDQVAEEEGYDPLASTIDADTTADDTTADTTSGQITSETGNRLYDYTNQREDGGSQNLYWGNFNKQLTADELEDAYNAPDNARLRESFGTFDNYLAYMDERQNLIEAGNYKADWWDTGEALVDVEGLGREGGQDDRALEMDIMQEGARQGEIGYNQQAGIFNSLYEKYTGESTTKYLDNGAKYEWNGTSFVLTQEAFGPHLGSMVGAALPGLILSAGLAGPLADVLQGAGLSSSVATGASQAIINGATQLAATGELDIKQALVAGAIAYGGAELGEVIRGSTELDGVLGDIASAAKDTANTLQELVETGIPIADAAIQAGGISMLTQLVTTGDIDLKQAALSAVLAGGKEAFFQFNDFMAQSGVSSDSYMNDLAEMEEFQQAAIDADIKDPFLNSNYQTVGDGSMVLNTVTNEVFSVTDDKSLGQFNELDSNSDGILDSNDLSFVEVTATPVETSYTTYQNLDPTLRHYVDADGNIRTDVRGISRETGAIIASDGTELFEARYDNGKLLVADETGAFNTIRNNDGSIYGTYNPETDEWVGADGQALNPSVGEYMRTKSGIYPPEDIYTGMTKTEYGEMSGPELFNDYFAKRGSDGQLALGDAEMQELVNRFGSSEAFEEWLQNPDPNNPGAGYGVNYSSGTGYVFEFGVDTSDGIYGFMGNDSTIPSLFEPDNLSGTRYFNANYVDTTKEQIVPPWVDLTETTTEVTTQQQTTTQQTETANLAQTSANLTTQLTNATSSQEAVEAVNTAAASGLSAAQIAALVSQALSGGSIDSGAASAASNAVEALTKSADVSEADVTTGDVATVTEVDVGGTDVTPKKDLGAGSGVLGGISGMLTGAQGVDRTPSGGDAGVTNGNGGPNVDPEVDPSGETTFPAAGTYAGGYCQTTGENGGTLVSIKHDGKGGTYQEQSFSASCKTTATTPTTPGTPGTTAIADVTPGGTSISGPTSGPSPGDGPGAGPGAGLGLGGGLLLGAAGGGQVPAFREFTPVSGKNIRIQAPEMLPDIVRQQDAVAQLIKAISTPYGTKPSGQQLNGLFDRLLLDQEKIA